MRACEMCGADIGHKKAVAVTCSVECNQKRLAARRKAAKWEGVDPSRTCRHCGGGMEGLRPQAAYCSRSCKSKASSLRARESGIAQIRDRARYPREAEARRAYARQYLKDNPEKMRAVRRRRKGQLKATAFRFNEKDWAFLLRQYRNSCAYCGATGDLVREHVVPLCRGGNHSVGNIVPACASCNSRKGRKLLAAFRHGRR